LSRQPEVSPAKVSPAMENYLEAILELGDEGDPARVTDIASRMGIAKASVAQALAGLRASGLVRQEPYGRVFLTAAGREHALRVDRSHRVLRTFLVDVLGVPPGTADAEACRLEHSITADTLERLVAFLESYHRQ